MGYNSKRTGAEVEALLDKVEQLSGSSGKIQVVDHGTSDTTFELTPGVVHKWGIVDSLSLGIPEDADNDKSKYIVVFTVGSNFFLSIPEHLRWLGGTPPTLKEGYQYELNLFDDRAVIGEFQSPFSIEGEFLDYVDSDGEDYVLTDIYIGSDISGMRCKSAQLVNWTRSVAVAGTRNVAASTKDAPFILWYLQNGRTLYWSGKNLGSMGSIETSTVYEDEYLGTPNSVQCNYPLVVFGCNNAGNPNNSSPNYNSQFRLFYLQLLDKSYNVVVALRPFRRASDGAVGLVDVVSNKFYPSANRNLVGGML